MSYDTLMNAVRSGKYSTPEPNLSTSSASGPGDSTPSTATGSPSMTKRLQETA